MMFVIVGAVVIAFSLIIGLVSIRNRKCDKMQKNAVIASRQANGQIGIGRFRIGNHTTDRILFQSTLFTIEEEEENGSQDTI